LPSRETEDVKTWLKQYSQIKVVSRDASISYKRAVDLALPNAFQISDRFHLIKNLTEACEDAIKQLMPVMLNLDYEKISAYSKGKLLAHERVSLEKFKQKNELFKKVKRYQRQGKNLTDIAEMSGVSKSRAAKWFKIEKLSPHASWGTTKKTKMDPYKKTVIDLLSKGMHGPEIIKHVRALGFKGADSRVKAFISQIRRDGVKNVMGRIYRNYEGISILPALPSRTVHISRS